MPRRGALTAYFAALVMRNRLTILLTVFALALASLSLVITYLTPGTERRTFFDLAYLGIEMLAVITPLLASSSLQMLEFEQKTSWLVLSRPVSRTGYVVGRLGGLAMATSLNVILAWAIVAALAVLMRAFPEPFMFAALLAALLEGVTVCALASLASLFATSYVTGVVIGGGVILLGYLSPALLFAAGRMANPVAAALTRGIYWMLPHLSNFSVREMVSPPEGWYLCMLAVYAAAWTGVATLVAVALFHRREP